MTNARLNSISNALNTHEYIPASYACSQYSRIGRDNLNALLSVLFVKSNYYDKPTALRWDIVSCGETTNLLGNPSSSTKNLLRTCFRRQLVPKKNAFPRKQRYACIPRRSLHSCALQSSHLTQGKIFLRGRTTTPTKGNGPFLVMGIQYPTTLLRMSEWLCSGDCEPIAKNVFRKTWGDCNCKSSGRSAWGDTMTFGRRIFLRMFFL